MVAVDVQVRELPHTGGGRILVWLVTPDMRPSTERVGDPESVRGWRPLARLSDRKYDRDGNLTEALRLHSKAVQPSGSPEDDPLAAQPHPAQQ